MPGTRTAPTVNGTPTFSRVSVRMIDASQDIRSVAWQLGLGATNAQIEAAVDNIQDYSNASMFQIEVTAVYNSAPAVTNALAEVYPSVYDNVVLLYKDALNNSQNIFIPAPTTDLQPSGSDSPDPVTLALIRASFAATMNGTGTAGWAPISARFSERREKNQRIFI